MTDGLVHLSGPDDLVCVEATQYVTDAVLRELLQALPDPLAGRFATAICRHGIGKLALSAEAPSGIGSRSDG
jgi:hypothetical protein